MANELTLSASLAFAKSGTNVDSRDLVVNGLTFTVSGTDYFRGTQTVGTSVEVLDIGDITTPGFVLIKNLDGTNFVTIRNGASGASVVKLKAGEFALFRSATTDLRAIADTASCQVGYIVVED